MYPAIFIHMWRIHVVEELHNLIDSSAAQWPIIFARVHNYTFTYRSFRFSGNRWSHTRVASAPWSWPNIIYMNPSHNPRMLLYNLTQ